MCRSEQEYIAKLQKHAAEALALLSNAQKPERERMVVRAFLRCEGIPFSDDEIQAGKEEPVDVVFRSARFQVTEVLGGRKRGLVWRQRQRRYQAARRVTDLREPWISSEPMSFSEISQLVSEGLAEKASHYGVKTCSELDALVNVDLSGRYLWPLEPALDAKVAEELSRQAWRSVSMLFVPYGVVVIATHDAPEFLKDRDGLILNEWPDPEGWFDP